MNVGLLFKMAKTRHQTRHQTRQKKQGEMVKMSGLSGRIQIESFPATATKLLLTLPLD